MRYAELRIETQRQMPARARTDGEALLQRAGYLVRERELSALGRRFRARLEELLKTRTPAEVFGLLDLPVLTTRSGEYFFSFDQGETELARCSSCGYTAARPLAKVKKQEPESEVAEAVKKIPTPDCHTIDGLARYLDIPKAKTAKALMYTRTKDSKFVFVVLRGDMQLSEAKLRRLIGDFRAATTDEIIAAGAMPGYASPLGLKEALVVADDVIPRSPNLVAGANEAGYHLMNTNYRRDYVADIVEDLVLAEADAPCAECGSPLRIIRADLLQDSDGFRLEALLSAVAQAHHDEKGLKLPVAAAPFEVYLLNVPGKELDTRAQAERLHDAWEAAGISVLFDDRNERAGVKFNDADLIGCPVRATVGEKGIKTGMVEFKARAQGESKLVSYAESIESIRALTQKPS